MLILLFERLRNNFGLKALSLALALAAWAYLRLAPNPVIAAKFVQQLTVPVATIGLSPDELARFDQKQVVVAVYVPRGATTIASDDVRAILNLAGRLPGVYNVPVEVIAPKLEVKSLSPASVTLTIERIEQRSVPVAIHYVGRRRNVVVKRVTVEPAYATLRGPTSDLARVNALRIDLPLPPLPSNLDAMVRPLPTDATGNEVNAVDVSPNLVRVRASFVAAGK